VFVRGFWSPGCLCLVDSVFGLVMENAWMSHADKLVGVSSWVPTSQNSPAAHCRTPVGEGVSEE
jgi:hypothetical protein